MPDLFVIRQQHAARNQAMFREINERLEEIGRDFEAREYQPFVCECAAAECIEPLELTIDEYESVRRDGATFVVAAGHIYPFVERVVLRNGRFTVVEKFEAAAELAQAHDPRART